MEELRKAAWGYFNNNPQIQEPARQFFALLDTNRDGRISLSEFLDFFSRQPGYSWVQDRASFFRYLDSDHDGSLDFSEVVTFYYILKTRNLFCKTCSTNLFGLYFTCTTCFDHDVVSYDLCLSCYGNRNYRHGHNRFVDSYTLLRSRTGASAVADAGGNLGHVAGHNQVSNSSSQAIVPYNGTQTQNQRPNPTVHQWPIYNAQANAPHQLQVQPQGGRMNYMQFLNAVHFMDAAMNVVPWLATLCTIM